MTEYRAILWDIGGVIIELQSIRDGYAAFVEDLSIERDLDPEPALERWKTTLGAHFNGREGTEYRLARDGYQKATVELFDGDPPTDWKHRLDRNVAASLRAKPGATQTIEALAENGYQLAIVSDIDTPEANRILDRFEIRDRFDHVTTSEAVGYTKPDERMFTNALDALEVDPARTLMVGDRYRHDVAGASRMGIDTAGYGPDARGPKTDYEIDDLRELLDVVDIEGAFT